MKKAGFKVLENEWIPLSDGRRLSARIWMPDSARKKPAPAILEYLPYRKRDGTAQRDESTYPSFARAGYVGVRVDISGTGESDGDWDDEYSARELADGCEIIEWIASQPWCDGNLGMMGISWGGFNSLQIAALQPEALKAVISIGTTVDRYNDDIHYKNGCLLYSNFSWSSTMLCFASRPPDPELVGDKWREIWLNRLKTQPFPLATWLANQRKNDYWKHGSISENYENVKIPALLISGWADGYINAPPAGATHLVNSKAINGPWIHKYPHFAWPKPRVDFLGEAIAWWDKWLKGKDNGVERLPAYRAYILEDARPLLKYEFQPGRWVAEQTLPAPETRSRYYYLAPNRQLLDIPGRSRQKTLSSPQDCGSGCGEFFPLKADGEMAGDQRHDDSGSLVFDSGKLQQPIEILGRPKLRLKLAIDKPLGNIAVRLNDIHPSGEVSRVSWGVLNLAHRNGNESPEPMVPGRTVAIEIELNECGYRFMRGHKMRVAISTAYWPMIMPPPERVTATINLGQDAFIELPVRAGVDVYEMPEPADENPLPEYKMHQPELSRRWIERNFQTGKSHYRVIDDSGEIEIPGHGLCTRHRHDERWTIAVDDPLSYRSESRYSCWMRRGDWSIHTEAESEFRCDADNFFIKATLRAYEGEELVHERSWDEIAIPRDHI
ncbi:MAG: CocE/NonD family hydrolase [Gammaproteobacteria bacterium]|jgi:putative CocE/NonD family hydrolase|nr:CocE/NonD family hydrolase [Gammaproteobacteria bacterium]